MKKSCFLLLMSQLVMEVTARDVVYSNLRGLSACEGDTVTSLKVEKRTENHILMTGGTSCKISVRSGDSMCKYLKSRCCAVQVDTSLYINRRQLRYRKFRFGGQYAPALRIGNHVYFSAIPLGSVAVGSDATIDVMLDGRFGDVIAASALTSKWVYYKTDPETSKVGFVGRGRMEELLEGHPDWEIAYLNESSESAKVTNKYLCLLKAEEEQRPSAIQFLLFF